MQTEREAAIFRLLEKSRLSPEELEKRLKRAADRRYWKRLNPQLSLQKEMGADFGVPPLRAGTFRQVLEKVEEDGYFQLPSIFPPRLIRRMRKGIDVLRAADWPPVFAMVYDEFWAVTRSPLLVRLLDRILGPGYGQIPHVWCHYVSPTPGSSGWWPHTDGFQRSGRMSIWIPLTDATVENGCIYLIPQDRVPEKLTREFSYRRRFSVREVDLLLQNCRALPANAGSVLGWSFGIIHWGSTASQASEPRISMAVEFISKDAVPEPYETPVLDAHNSIPPFRDRLTCIGRALLSYQKFEPKIIRFGELAEGLIGN